MRCLLVASLVLSTLLATAQPKTAKTTTTASAGATLARPKLVVGIIIDQMRWDYLYRYYDRYAADGGFKRFLNQGFSAENTLIPYLPTVTACGHTCAYTGSVPAIHGIISNGWFDPQRQRNVYCTEDSTVSAIGGTPGGDGSMSPRNMAVTTVTDELRLATNFRSKVIGIAIKDRGGILPAGHSANAAYWYDSRTGNWITSSYYMNELPKWVQDINASKPADKYYAQPWNTLYPIETYVQSTADEKPYEGKPLGTEQTKFPYDLKKFVGTNYGAICSTPYGNSITADLAKAAVTNEQMGADAITDFLAVSFSSPDYIGHAFGPNSIEQEDDYLRLDKEIGSFFAFLDSKVGKGQWTVFLSADHAVAHVPGFMKENKLPGGNSGSSRWMPELNKMLQSKYNVSTIIRNVSNYQIYLNHRVLDSLKVNEDEVENLIVDHLARQPEILRAFPLRKVTETPLPKTLREMAVNGYNQKLSGDIQIMYQSNYMEAGPTGTTHSSWNPYDAHIPFLLYGWGIKPGKLNRETYMTDIAPTIAALLHIQNPSGNVGHVVEEALK